jgi:hypothetical protein
LSLLRGFARAAGIDVANQVELAFQNKVAKQPASRKLQTIAKGGEQALFSSIFNPQDKHQQQQQ